MSKRKEETRKRIIAAAGKGIREHGYGGIGVDGIAKEAGVTSGAFYGHFKSKDNVFEASASAGMKEFVDGIYFWRESKGDKWVNPFIDWYLSVEKRHDICGGCALPGLSADIARAGKEVHIAYEEQLIDLVEAIADGFSAGTKAARKKTAWSFLSILSGGVMMSRAVDDEKIATEIANSVRKTAKKLIADLDK